MANELVTVAKFIDPVEADMARLKLEGEGIESFIQGENIIRWVSPMIGAVELKVKSSDADRALKILAGQPDKIQEEQ